MTATTTADTLTSTKLDAMPTPLARARACTPLSVRDVAAALGMAASQLCAYETGKATPKPATQRRLAAFYGVPVSSLFGGDR